MSELLFAWAETSLSVIPEALSGLYLFAEFPSSRDLLKLMVECVSV